MTKQFEYDSSAQKNDNNDYGIEVLFGDLTLDDWGWSHIAGYVNRSYTTLIDVGVHENDDGNIVPNNPKTFGKIVKMSDAEYLLFSMISSFKWNVEGSTAKPSMKRLVGMTGKIAQSVRNSKNKMISKGWLKVTHRSHLSEPDIYDFSNLINMCKMWEAFWIKKGDKRATRFVVGVEQFASQDDIDAQTKLITRFLSGINEDTPPNELGVTPPKVLESPPPNGLGVKSITYKSINKSRDKSLDGKPENVSGLGLEAKEKEKEQSSQTEKFPIDSTKRDIKSSVPATPDFSALHRRKSSAEPASGVATDFVNDKKDVELLVDWVKAVLLTQNLTREAENFSGGKDYKIPTLGHYINVAKELFDVAKEYGTKEKPYQECDRLWWYLMSVKELPQGTTGVQSMSRYYREFLNSIHSETGKRIRAEEQKQVDALNQERMKAEEVKREEVKAKPYLRYGEEDYTTYDDDAFEIILAKLPPMFHDRMRQQRNRQLYDKAKL